MNLEYNVVPFSPKRTQLNIESVYAANMTILFSRINQLREELALAESSSQNTIINKTRDGLFVSCHEQGYFIDVVGKSLADEFIENLSKQGRRLRSQVLAHSGYEYVLTSVADDYDKDSHLAYLAEKAKKDVEDKIKSLETRVEAILVEVRKLQKWCLAENAKYTTNIECDPKRYK